MISALIKKNLGLELPSGLRVEFGENVAGALARRGRFSNVDILDLFEKIYGIREAPLLQLKDYMIDVERSSFQKPRGMSRSFKGIVSIGGMDHNLVGRGSGPISSLANALKGLGLNIRVRDYSEHAIGEGEDVRAATFLQVREESPSGEKGRSAWGVAIHDDVYESSLQALLSAASQLV